MKIFFPKNEREQSLGEELANSICHGIGVVAALVGTPFLIIHAAQHHDAGFIVGVSLFSATAIILYLASTLYHAWPSGKAKHVFRIIDYSAVFLLIAGTYMPFTFGVLRGGWGWTLFGCIWGLAIAGGIMKVFDRFSHPVLFPCIYLLMGWLIVIAAGPLIDRVPTPGLILLAAGGLCYTLGVLFFAMDSWLRYGHFIWHIFVLGGTTCHYFAVFWYAA